MGPIRTARAVSSCETRTRTLSAAAALTLAVLLAGCSSAADNELGYACPDVAIIRDLSLITRFGGGSLQPDEQRFSGEIVSANGECGFGDGAVEVSLAVSMVYDRPPGRPEVNEPVAFFVAVARPDGTIVGKQQFESAVDFLESENRAGFREELSVTVPLPQGPESAEGYALLVGFQLSAAELEYNRQRSR